MQTNTPTVITHSDESALLGTRVTRGTRVTAGTTSVAGAGLGHLHVMVLG